MWSFLQGVENYSVQVTWVWTVISKYYLNFQILSDLPYPWNLPVS